MQVELGGASFVAVLGFEDQPFLLRYLGLCRTDISACIEVWIEPFNGAFGRAFDGTFEWNVRMERSNEMFDSTLILTSTTSR